MIKARLPKMLIIIAVVFLVIIAGYRLLSGSFHGPVTASGTVEATTLKITARTAGTIDKMLASEGDKVKAGQLLAEMVRSDLQAQRERDAMAVAAATARWQDLASGPRSQEITEAAAAVEQARINANQVETDLNRIKSLTEQGALPAQALEQAQNNWALKQEQLRSAQARLQNLQAGSREQTIAAAWAELERAKAVLKASDAMLADLKLYSPLNGTVLQRFFEPGEYAPMGAALYQLADLKNLWVRVYIPTDELPGIKVGDVVTCTVSGSDQKFKGYVEKINSQGEFTPKTIQTKNERANVVYGVRIKLTNSGGILKPGMPIDVVFAGDTND